jgi:hypothetical protein
MAIAFGADLGSTQVAASASTVALTTANTAVAGSLIVVGVSENSGVALSSVGDGTNTYSLLGPRQDVGGHRVWMAYTYAAAQLTSGATITATFGSATSERMIGAISFTGIASTSPLTGSAATNAESSATTFTGPAITPADADAVVCCFVITDGVGNPQMTSPGSSFIVQLGGTSPNDEWNFSAGGAQKSASMLYRIVSSVAAYTASGTWDESQAGGFGASIAAAFKAGAASQTPPYVNVSVG